LGEEYALSVISCVRICVRKTFQRRQKLEKIGKGLQTGIKQFQ